MTTVETRVVNPVSRGSVDNVRAHATEAELDAAMNHEEETSILVDEDVCSSEGEIENHMLTVALVNSVVEASPADPTGRYGLRKRRRPGDVTSAEPVNDPTRPNHVTSGAGGHAPSAVPSSKVGSTQHLNKTHRTVPVKQQELRTVPPTHNPLAAKQRQEPLIIKQPNAKEGTQIKDHPILGKLSANFTHLAGSGKSPVPLLPPVKPVTSAKQKPVAPRAKVAKLSHPGHQPLVRQNLVPTSGAVPNPLSHTSASTVSEPRSYAPKIPNHPGAKSKAVPCPLPSSVPCPLPSPSVAPPAAARPAAVPSVVPSAVPSREKKRVIITEPTVPPARARIFSVDLDPSTFDFSDMAGDHNVHDRSDSVDMPPPDSTDFPVLQRDRAFSFDLFNFTHDDLLSSGGPSSELSHPGAPQLLDDMAPLPHPRPRGDSIIFDPVSFQDGGIHEKNALAKAREAVPSAPHRPVLPPPTMSSDPTRAGMNPPGTVTPIPAYSGVPRDPMASPGQIATLPSSLSNTSPTNANASPATFQMELLNKDGRIGIYLPEARKARIARFHAKRKMRIWRKRIKYDCRKKLADSRPRIKGRFVKRCDMDGDE